MLPERFVVERGDPAAVASDRGIVVVRAPEGVTIVRPVRGDRDGEPPADWWVALYGDETGHGLDVPGMLVGLLTPLAAAGIPVFVASTFVADLVFVPEGRTEEAVSALRAAGHTVAG